VAVTSDRLFAEQEAGHVEIVDGHVAEDAAGALDVIDRRGARIARGDRHHFDVADAAIVDRLAHGHEMRIEAAVEADHQLALGLINHLDAGLDPGDVEIDRLFAEDRLAGAGKTLDQVGMGVGRRADDDGVDILCRFDRLDGADVAAVGRCDGVGGLRKGVGDGDERGVRIGADRLGVNLADTTGAEKTKSDCHDFLP
jgi:hypothetical protein